MPHTLDRMPQVAVLLPTSVKVSRDMRSPGKSVKPDSTATFMARCPKRSRMDTGLERDRLCAWLRDLPKPVALLAAMDNRGRQVMDACAWA